MQQAAIKNPRGIQLEKKTDIQYRGAAGDAGNDLLDQSSSNMVSQYRQDESSKVLMENSSNNKSTKDMPNFNGDCLITSPLGENIDFDAKIKNPGDIVYF